MSENLKRFLEAASKDADLAEKLKAAKSGEEIVELAKTLGFTLTEADFKAPEGEVSDDELEGVAGGFSLGGCDCALGGSGGIDWPLICGCFHGGGGGGSTPEPGCVIGGGTIDPRGACGCYHGGGGA